MAFRKTASAEAQKRRIWHFKPYWPKLSEQVIQHTPSCVAAVAGWIASARADEKRWPLNRPTKFPEKWQNGDPLPPPGPPKDDDDLRCDIAGALAAGIAEWDGFLIAEQLMRRNWPADAELVQVLHRWSCDLRRSEYAAYKASQEKPANKILPS